MSELNHETNQEQEILENRRERFEEKRERRTEAYERLRNKHRKLSRDRYEAAKQIGDAIPFGQPILIGHHSERGHRAALDRIDNNMRKSIEHSKTADYYDGKLAAMESNQAISSDDPDAIAKLETKLADMQEYQELMKAANKIIRKKITDDKKIEHLKELGLGESNSRKLLQPDFCGRIGFPDFRLQNNNANIRRVKERIQELKDKLAKACETPIENQEYPELGLTVVHNREIDRLQLVFDGKPPQPTREFLKSCGFKWSPGEGAWQRQLNSTAEYAVQRVITYLLAAK